MKSIIDLIEAARRAGTIGNDAARAASIALTLTGDDAMLACRVLAQGADPASLEYLVDGAVSAPIALAHRQGPGSLTGDDRSRWLALAAISHDESQTSTLRERVLSIVDGVRGAREHRARPGARAADVRAKEAEIRALTFKRAVVGGREMRVYANDLGFAAAYWDGEPCAAVLSFNGGPHVQVGSNGTPLTTLGVTVEKPLAPCFGSIESPAALAALAGATGG